MIPSEKFVKFKNKIKLKNREKFYFSLYKGTPLFVYCKVLGSAHPGFLTLLLKLLGISYVYLKLIAVIYPFIIIYI